MQAANRMGSKAVETDGRSVGREVQQRGSEGGHGLSGVPTGAGVGVPVRSRALPGIYLRTTHTTTTKASRAMANRSPSVI